MHDSAEKISSIIQWIVQPSSPILLSWAEAARITDMHLATDVWSIASRANIAWLVDIDFGATSTVTDDRVHQISSDLAGYKLIEDLLRRNEVLFTNKAVLAIAGIFDEGIVRLLVERDDFQLVSELLLAAAQKTNYHSSVLRLLSKQAGQVTLTDRFIELTAYCSNSEQSVEMFLRHSNVCITDEAIVALARSHSPEACCLLPEGRTITIHQALLEAAVQNSHYNHNHIIMALLSGDVRVDLMEGVISIMIIHFQHEVIATLLNHSTSKAEITESVVKMIVEARRAAPTIRLFLERGGHENVAIKNAMQMLVDAGDDLDICLEFWKQNFSGIAVGAASL